MRHSTPPGDSTILGQLARLLNFSLSLSSNENDSRFLRRMRAQGLDPEIIYVFDHTLLEMFLALDEQTRKYPAAFHLSEWRATSQLRDMNKLQALWTSLNRQTAIVTAEYLVSGGLPGQSDGQFYMTSGHYEEFCKAVDRRRENAEARRSMLGESVARVLKGVDAVGLTGSTGDQLTELDVTALFGQDERTRHSDVSEFRKSRLVANLLSEEEETFQLHQAARAGSRGFLDRIASLSLRYRLDGSGGAPLENWRETLEGVDAIRGGRGARKPLNLRRDEQAISHIQWIARTQLEPHQRIVFVTGDPLILLAYAKWHTKRVVTDPAEPRIVRNIQQFSPILNMGDMKVGFEDTWKIFDMLRETVETPLLAFNLSNSSRIKSDQITVSDDQDDSDSESEEIAYSSRTDLLLRLDGLEDFEPIELFFARRLTRTWYSENADKFAAIARSLRQFERIAIGLNSRFIQRRIQAFLEEYQAWTDETRLGSEPQRFVEMLLEKTARQSVELWFPVALTSLRAGERRRKSIARTPRYIQLRIGEGADSPKLVDLVEVWLESDDIPQEMTTAEFRTKRYLVFAAASMAAMRLGRWTNAHRFSELAVSAAMFHSGDAEREADRELPKSQPHFQELLYLRALSCRLRLGARGPIDLAGDDIWAALLDQGIQDLMRCEMYHESRGDTRELLRSKSEMVALRGFYVSWSPVLFNRAASQKLTIPHPRGYSPTRAEMEYELHLRDLRSALAIVDALPDANDESYRDYPILQLRANVAAAYSVSRLPMGGNEKIFFEVLGEQCLSNTVKWWRLYLGKDTMMEQLKTVPSLVRIQLAIFFAVFAPEIVIPPDLIAAGTAPVLSLDEELSGLLTGVLKDVTEKPEQIGVVPFG